MLTTLSELVEKTQGEAIPEWLRNALLERKSEIASALREKAEYILKGQNGEQIIIRAAKRTAA